MSDSRFRDLDLSFLVNPITGDVSKTVDVDAIKKSVINLIKIRKGDKPFHPEVSSGVMDLLFEPASPITAIRLEREIRRVIGTYDTRVSLNKVEVQLSQGGNGFHVSIEFFIRNVARPVNLNFSLDRLR